MNEDEIDLRELFASLWAGKFVIGIVTALALAGAVIYALTADEEYQSAAVFELKS
jgi:LPS O-antigen subunit length determinant protein (WzzB/FepE family)